jgi:hypothetical protein
MAMHEKDLDCSKDKIEEGSIFFNDPTNPKPIEYHIGFGFDVNGTLGRHHPSLVYGKKELNQKPMQNFTIQVILLIDFALETQALY